MQRTRSVLATGVIVGLGLGFSSAADARTGDPLREGVRNGTTTRETRVISNISGYTTRQSNKSTTGGGAIYGCRSTAASSRPCLRASNLSSGRAFEFGTASGLLGGLITVGAGGDTRKPFTTNATGVATGLNADRVDSLSASDIVAGARVKAGLDADTVDGLGSTQLRTRWALINEAGAIEEQSGGFSVTSAYANANVYINAGESLTDNGLAATVALQNNIDRDGAPGADPTLGGSVVVSRCATAATTCAPAGTNTDTHVVVAPRIPTAPGGAGAITFADTTPTTRLRFYVTVTE